MKINVKVGDIYQRVAISDGTSSEDRMAITRHIASCPRCQQMIYKRKSGRSA